MNGAVKILLALISSGGVAGSALAQQAVALPVYPKAVSRPFAGRLEANQIPIDAVVLETSDSLEQVLDFYRRDLSPKVKHVVEHHFDPALAYIGFYDEQAESMRLATLIRMPQGVTWVILSGMDPRMLARPMDVPPGLPAVEGAGGVVITSSNERGGRSSTVSFTVEGKPPERVRAELEESARSLGWQREKGRATGEQEILAFEREGKHCVVQFLIMDTSPDRPVTRVSLVVFESVAGK